MTSTAHDIDLGALAQSVLDDAGRELGLDNSELPAGVRDSHADFRAAVTDALDAGRQLQTDLDELQTKADLLPSQGYQRLRSEVLKEAQERAAETDRRAERTLEQIRSELVVAAQPRIDSAREALGRDELVMALGDATAFHAEAALMRVAQHGSADAVAVLVSTSFGETLLASRDVPNPGIALNRIRGFVAAIAAERGRTPREIIAGKALEGLGKLGAAKGAAGSYVLEGIRRAGG